MGTEYILSAHREPSVGERRCGGCIISPRSRQLNSFLSKYARFLTVKRECIVGCIRDADSSANLEWYRGDKPSPL